MSVNISFYNRTLTRMKMKMYDAKTKRKRHFHLLHVGFPRIAKQFPQSLIYLSLDLFLMSSISKHYIKSHVIL